MQILIEVSLIKCKSALFRGVARIMSTIWTLPHSLQFFRLSS